jgi:hypothetical protein
VEDIVTIDISRGSIALAVGSLAQLTVCDTLPSILSCCGFVRRLELLQLKARHSIRLEARTISRAAS